MMHLSPRRLASIFAVASTGALAQAPLFQDGAQQLRNERLAWALGDPAPTPLHIPSLEVGLGGAGSQGTYTPLVGGEGFGNGTQGWGTGIQGRYFTGGWELSATATLLRQDGITKGSLQRGALAYRSEGGWRFALEQTPFQWGFGPNGGYLMGDSAKPLPRVSVTTPEANLHLWSVPLGRWSAEFFYGRLEWNREIPDWMSNRLTQVAAKADHGDIRRPDLSGARFTGRFGPYVELNLAGVSMWGGVDPQGNNRRRGYTLDDYLLGFFGAENIGRSEASGGQGHFDLSGFKQISMAHAMAEGRVRIPALAQWLGARGASVYLSRGSKNVNWQWKDFLRNPGPAIGHDLSKDWNLIKRGKIKGGDYMSSIWGRGTREAVPTLEHANDMIGFQLVFDTWDLAVDYADTVNIPADGGGYRVYSHSTYLAGLSRYGDAMGLPFGGDTLTRTVDLGFQLPREGKGTLKLVKGTRVFRDNLALWTVAHPGTIPQLNNFWFLQANVQWRTAVGRIGGSLATEREAAPDYQRNQPARWGWAFTVFQSFRVF
jgi:hypothetical protein